MYILTLNQIVEKFREWSENHKFINDFGYGDSSMIGDSRAVKYPLMWSTHSRPSTIQVSNKTQIPTHSFSFIFVDVINIQDNYKDENGFESDNSQEVLSDTQQYAQDFILFLTSYMSKFGLVIRDNDITLTQVFDNLTTDKVCGWTVDIDITAKHSNCVTPADGVGPSQPPMPTPTSVTYLTCDTLPDCQTIIDIETNLNTIEGDITKTATLGTNDILTFKNTSGATLYTVDLSSLGGGSSANDYTIAATLSGNILTFDRTDLNSAYSVDLSGLAGTGGLTCADLPTCQTIIDIENNITTLQNNQFSGNYNDLTNKPTLLSQFTNDVGYITSYTDTNDYTTSAIFSNGILTFDRTDLNSAYSIDISSVNTDTNYYVNGATLSGTTLTATGNDISTGFSIDLSSINTDTDTNDYTIGATLSGNIINFDRTDLVSAYSIDLSPILFSGNYNDLTNAPTNVSAFTNDAGYITTDTNDYTTSATFSNGIITYNRTDLNSAYSIDISSINTDTNDYTTGATLSGNIINFDRTDTLSAYNIDLTPILFTGNYNDLTNAPTNVSAFTNDAGYITTDTNDYTTTATLDVNNVLRFDRTDLNNAYSVDLSSIASGGGNYLPLTGGTLTGSLTISGADLNVDDRFKVDANGVYGYKGNANNLMYGNGAMLNASTLAGPNVAIGNSTLQDLLDTADNNVAIGSQTLQKNTGGRGNIGLGKDALRFNLTGSNNIAIGLNSMVQNTKTDNIAIGSYSMFNAEGGSHIAIGSYALYSNTSGVSNIALGGNALYSNTSGDGNTALGKKALYNNTTGDASTAIGFEALNRHTGNGDNTAVGYYSLRLQTGGVFNVSMGGFAGDNIATNNNSVFIGHKAANKSTGIDILSTTDCIYLGSNSHSSVQNPINEIVIGNDSVGNGDNTTTIGNNSTLATYIQGQLNIDIINNGQGNFITKNASGTLTERTPAQVVSDLGVTNTNDYTTSATFSAGTITFDRTDLASAYSVDISGVNTDTNDYTNAASISGNIITFDRTDLASAYNVDISPALTPLQNDITTNTNNITTLQTVEYWTVELMDKLIYTIYASEAISITLITNIVNAPTTTIKVNGAAYTLGNPIASGDKIDVEVNTAAVVKLKIEK